VALLRTSEELPAFYSCVSVSVWNWHLWRK
jgi:hypothetical protein